MSFYEIRDRDSRRLDDSLEELAHSVIGAAIEVHRHLGAGLPENSYRDALSHEFDLRAIPHQREFPVDILYKNKCVGRGRIDLLVGGKLIVELKVVEQITALHRAQVISYLKITKLQLAIIINFNVEVLKSGLKRIINS